MSLSNKSTLNQKNRIGQTNERGIHSRLAAAIWWVFLVICVVLGSYALYLGGLELAVQLGFAHSGPDRAVPGAFILHALTGGVVLIVGPLQFRNAIHLKKRTMHRFLGRVYVVTVSIASLTGLWSAVFFDRGIPARVIFILIATLWFTTTTLAYLRARRRRFKAHRAWMIRSFAFSLFFATFPSWVEGLAGTMLPENVGYPMGLFLAATVNLAVAELWIHTRAP